MGGSASIRRTNSSTSSPGRSHSSRATIRPRIATWPALPFRTVIVPDPVATSSSIESPTSRFRSKEPVMSCANASAPTPSATQRSRVSLKPAFLKACLFVFSGRYMFLLLTSLAADPTVLELDYAPAKAGNALVVRNLNDRRALLIQLAQQLHDLLALAPM